MNTLNLSPLSITPISEVSVALQDFFADKTKRVRKELSPTASKLAWAIKRLVGVVRSEDLDSIQREFPTQAAFQAFTGRVVNLEKTTPASLKPLAGLEQLEGSHDFNIAASLSVSTSV